MDPCSSDTCDHGIGDLDRCLGGGLDADQAEDAQIKEQQVIQAHLRIHYQHAHLSSEEA